LPQFVEPTLGTKLWCRFFCHSVYITMYLNDHSRTAFYESLGLNTRLFNQHVILETNNSTERIFPEVPDVEDPRYFPRMDALIALSEKLKSIDRGDLPAPLKALAKAPVYERMVAGIFQLFIGPVKRTGSYDLAADPKALVY
jgi:magnesium-protoporphyrin IX monomethyl ester (oxidative) cyclase